ncbi:MAG: hypothetical protein LKJ45_02380 [Oscillospiraceae bacterium]|jgi:hypothetical protein|nr:hypothetical protein [Oscillospiraceae bacterium]
MSASIYGNVGGAARKAKELWVNVNGVTRPIKELWANVNGVTRKIYQARPELVSVTYSGLRPAGNEGSYGFSTAGISGSYFEITFKYLDPTENVANIRLKLDRAFSIKRARINAHWYDIDNSVGGTNNYLEIHWIIMDIDSYNKEGVGINSENTSDSGFGESSSGWWDCNINYVPNGCSHPEDEFCIVVDATNWAKTRGIEASIYVQLELDTLEYGIVQIPVI